MTGSETQVGGIDWETVTFETHAGQRVRIGAGQLRGVEGTVVEQRTSGRVLLELQQGVFVEVHPICLDAAAEGP